MTNSDEMVKLAERALREDDDHIVATDSGLDWLIAQLACWPTRVDPDCTTNIRFLMTSAAATLLALRTPRRTPNAH